MEEKIFKRRTSRHIQRGQPSVFGRFTRIRISVLARPAWLTGSRSAQAMNFRLIEPKDLSEIIEVRASTRENPFSREALRQLGITEESTAELLRTTHRGWLCEEEGSIVGFSIGDGKTGELWVIAVLPEFERRGVGSRLLQSVEASLWSLGLNELWLWTSPDPQKRAFTFYQKHDWMVSELKDGMLYMKKRKPNHPLERGAESRPCSDDLPVSEPPSSPGPRG